LVGKFGLGVVSLVYLLRNCNSLGLWQPYPANQVEMPSATLVLSIGYQRCFCNRMEKTAAVLLTLHVASVGPPPLPFFNPLERSWFVDHEYPL